MDDAHDAHVFASITEWCQAWIQSLLSIFFQTGVTFEHCGLTVYFNPNNSSAGEGAYSTVYKATQAFTQEPVYALKRMLIQSDEIRQIANTEIDAYNKFRHPHIIKLLDHARATESGKRVVYLLFPFMERGSLRDSPGTTVRNQRTLITVLSKFVHICEALNVLHKETPAYVHQDIKLENILVDTDGAPFLIDFGSVRKAELIIKNRKDSLRVAEDAASHCTASYRAPELYDPPQGSTLDTRTDVWSLGCLLFAWWFGHSPFECEFHGDLVKVVECSALRVLAAIPRPVNPTKEDSIVLSLVEWILVQDHTVRPFTSDVIERVNSVMNNVERQYHAV